MSEDRDEWRQLSQCLPEDIYTRLMTQMVRVGLSNGIGAEEFTVDDKKAQKVGPRVHAWECLVLVLEEAPNSALKA